MIHLHIPSLRVTNHIQLGMGLGGPIGGLMTDWYAHPVLPVLNDPNLTHPQVWLALGLPSPNTLVRAVIMSDSLQLAICHTGECSLETSCSSKYLSHHAKGTGKTTAGILKRIDYGGSLTLFGCVRTQTSLYRCCLVHA